jgi:predicted MFS family arabinose efflux permease
MFAVYSYISPLLTDRSAFDMANALGAWRGGIVLAALALEQHQGRSSQ